MLFAVPFTGFAVFWMAAASGMLFGPHVQRAPAPGAFQFFPLFGIPFLLIGLGMLLSPLTYKRWARQNTRYAVTSKRVLVLKTKPTRSLQGMLIRDIPNVDKSVRPNGVGTVNFGNPAMNMMFQNTGNSTSCPVPMCPVFYNIADADFVYKTVCSLKEKETEPAK
jgi:hypothetical protein